MDKLTAETLEDVRPSEIIGTETIVVRRRFAASPDRVFAAWTTADQLEKWWGPEGFETVVTELDPKPGGAFRYEMTGPRGGEGVIAGTFREVVAPRRLVMIMTEHCNCGLPDDIEPQLTTTRVTVDFVALSDGETEVVITEEGLNSPRMAELHVWGWTTSLEGLSVG